MSVTLKFDMRQFNATLAKLAGQTNKAAREFINQKAYDVAVTAANSTKIADKNEIARVLGQTGTQLNYTKKGDRLRKRSRGDAIIKDDSFGARIVNARRRDHAGPDFTLWGNALQDAVRKLIRARQNSVGFIASGFVRAARQLRRFAKYKARETPKGIRVIPNGPGGKGTPVSATPGNSVFIATVSTDVVLSGGKFQAKGTFNPRPIAEAALMKGLSDAKARMETSLSKRMVEAAKAAGAL